MKAVFTLLILFTVNAHALELGVLVEEGSTLLKSLNFQSDLVGMSAEEAKEQCSKFKRSYKKSYMHVYCIFHVKSKITYITSNTSTSWSVDSSTMKNDYEYEYEYASNLSNYEYEYEYEKESNSETNSNYSGSSHTTTVTPVKYSFYGVNIYGIGDPNSQKKYLVFDRTSVKYYEGFYSRKVAQRACQEYLYEQDDHDISYYKAYCEVVKSQFDGLYRYAIYSKIKLI